MPRVSVIIPTYNRRNLLGRAINSVLNQTYQDFELIIVDDGSTDNTVKLVKSLNSKKIRFIRHNEKRGVAAALNTGLQSAVGDYMAFLDSDDEWVPDKLESQIRAFETSKPEVGIVCTGYWLATNGRRRYVPLMKVNAKEKSIFSNIVKRYFVCTPVLMIKRECFETDGTFDEQFPALSDWELFLRFSRHYRFQSINKPLVIRYRQPDSVSSNLSYFTSGFKLLLEKYYHDIEQDKKLLAGCYFKLGHLLSIQGELTQGRRYFIRSIEAYPLNLMASIALLVSMLGQSSYNAVTRSYRLILGIALRNQLFH